MLNIGVEEGSVPPSRHGPQAPHRQPDLGHAHKVQKLGGQSPFLAPKEQSIKDVIMAEVGLPRVHMAGDNAWTWAGCPLRDGCLAGLSQALVFTCMHLPAALQLRYAQS
eukprot:1157510-Pelagomonas_calceolata.AAC.15